MAATRPGPALRRIFRAPALLYRWSCGWLFGHRFLLLIHRGRRTGLRRYTVIEVLEYRKDGPEVIVMSAFGRNADWMRNIEASPNPKVVIGCRRFIADCSLLDEEEAMQVVAGYERRNRLIAPIIRAVLTRLLGWGYDSSADARQRLVRQLPLVAFRRIR